MHRVIVPMLLMLLSACVSRPVMIGNDVVDDQVWSMSGKLGVSAGREHGTFGVNWRQDNDRYEINLLGPLGIGVARVSGEPGRVVLDVPREEPRTADSADDLLHEALGFDIPVAPLRYWIRGNPAPGPYQTTPGGLRQMGWEIEYLKYAGRLPVKMRLTRPEVKLVMVIREWVD